MSLALRTLVAAAALVAAPPAGAAERPPQVERASAAIVIDARDGAVMFERAARERRQIASTTKLMTALLALERTTPRQVLTSPGYDPLPAESRINLRRGERMTSEDLLEALLLESANDAAVTFAESISGSRSAFVRAMNERAEELGLRDTSFANPIGLDDPLNYSSAHDLARLSRRLMRNRRFARIVDKPQAVLESGARRRVIANRNRLVARFGFVEGIKTGYTRGAGYVLIGAARGRGGARVISVVLGEPGEAARNEDTLALLRWGLGRFRRVRAVASRRVFARAGIEYRDERLALVAARPHALTLRAGQKLRRRVRAPGEVEGPIERGARLGSVSVFVDGRPVKRIPLVAARAVPEAGALRVLVSKLGVPLSILIVSAVLIAAALAALRFRVRLVRGGKEQRTTT